MKTEKEPEHKHILKLDKKTAKKARELREKNTHLDHYQINPAKGSKKCPF